MVMARIFRKTFKCTSLKHVANTVQSFNIPFSINWSKYGLTAREVRQFQERGCDLLITSKARDLEDIELKYSTSDYIEEDGVLLPRVNSAYRVYWKDGVVDDEWRVLEKQGWQVDCVSGFVLDDEGKRKPGVYSVLENIRQNHDPDQPFDVGDDTIVFVSVIWPIVLTNGGNHMFGKKRLYVVVYNRNIKG
jgi:hypothetical protein